MLRACRTYIVRLKTALPYSFWGATLCIACSAGATTAVQRQTSSALTVAADKGPVRGLAFLALSSAMSDSAPSVSIAMCAAVVGWQKQAATSAPVYAYEFSDPNARVPLPLAPFKAMLVAGPIHAAELQYLFPNLASPFSANANASGLPLPQAERALSDAMIRYWTTFVATGNPNASGLPHWPIFRKATDTLQFSDGAHGIRIGVNVDAKHHCPSFWKPLEAPASLLK